MKKNNENGRSMVEILGILAVIGVLSIGGIQGYKYAMGRIKLNGIIELFQYYQLALADVFAKGENVKFMSGDSSEAFRNNQQVLLDTGLIPEKWHDYWGGSFSSKWGLRALLTYSNRRETITIVWVKPLSADGKNFMEGCLNLLSIPFPKNAYARMVALEGVYYPFDGIALDENDITDPVEYCRKATAVYESYSGYNYMFLYNLENL